MKVFVIKVLKSKTVNVSSENQFKRIKKYLWWFGMWDPLRSGSVLRQLDHGQHVVLSDQISVFRATEIVRIGIGNLQDLRGQVTLKVVASERVIPGFLWEERKRHSQWTTEGIL